MTSTPTPIRPLDHASVEFMSAADCYDALTLEVERADVLAEHLAERLSDLSDGRSSFERELYALSQIAEDIRRKHARIVERAGALLAAGGAQ